MSRDLRFLMGSDNFSRNLLKETPESDYQRHMYNIEFQHNATRNVPVYSNLVKTHSEYDPTKIYFEPSSNSNDNIQTYQRPDMSPYRSRIDHSSQWKETRLNTYDYPDHLPTSNNFVQPYQSDILRSYFQEDEENKSEYERNLNVLNSYHNSERGNFNNSSPGYHHNNLRNEISRSRDTNQPSLFSRRKEIYSSRPPLLSNPREGNSHIRRINSERLEKPRERPPHRSPLALRTHRSPNFSYPSASFDYRKNLKIKKPENAIARQTAIQNSRKLESDRRSDIKTINKSKNETIKRKNEFGVGFKNDKGISKNRNSQIRNGEELELVCPHCNSKSYTSDRYISHLKSPRHLKAFKEVVLQCNVTLNKIRINQRRAQNEIEENVDDLESSTRFCATCRLNYQQSEATHRASKYHTKIKDIVERYCKFCKVGFKSHMAYETHICSLAHLRNVASDKNISHDKMNIIDKANGEADDVVIKTSKKKLVIVGREKVCKVEVYYCELCKIYLPRVSNDRLEEVISAHCSEQLHLKYYYRYRKTNKCSNHDEVLAKQEDLKKKEEIVDNQLDKCIDVSYGYNEELPDEEQPQLKERSTEEYEETSSEFENSENKDDMDKPYLQKEDFCINQDESQVQRNKCIDNSFHNNDQFSIIEEPIVKKKIPVTDENDDNNSEKFENSENKIVDEVDNPKLQEGVNTDDQDEPDMQESPLSTSVDDKQWYIDINPDLTNINAETENDPDTQFKSEP